MFVYRMVKEELYLEECGSYHSYGIRVENEKGEVLDMVSDISTEQDAVSELTARCLHGELDPVHLRDVVTDYLETAALPFR